MARTMVTAPRTMRSGRGTGSDESPHPPSSRSRKRAVKEDPEEEEEEEEEEEPTQPRRRKQSRTSEDGLGGGSSSGGGGSGSGSGGGAGSGSGSGGRRRGSGFHDISSQNDDEADEGEMLPFSPSQGVARSQMIKAAKKATKEVEIQEKDIKKASELSDTERKDLVKQMVRYLLMKGLHHEPVTKKEMMDLVLGKKYRSKGVLKYILTTADKQLQAGVGLRVKNVGSGNDWFVKDTYYVINVLDNTQHSKEILSSRGRTSRGLLVLILSIIHCSPDKVVGEDQLFKKLHDHIDKRIPEKPWQNNASKTKVRAHVDGLGDLHDHLATFVKQHYLMKKTLEKPTTDGGTESIPAYSFGARSALELGTHQLLELMAQALGTTVDPSELLALEGEQGESQGPSQMATQDN